MKRDKHLQWLILMHVREGKEHPELKKYSEQEQVYNGALLIEDGYVEGHVGLNSSGFPTATRMSHLTSKGHDFLDEMEPKQQAVATDASLTLPSHSSVVAKAKLPNGVKKLLEEAVEHLRIRHRQKVEQAIRNLQFKLANQHLSRSSAANQQMLQIFFDQFVVFAKEVLDAVKEILSETYDGELDEGEVMRFVDEILDATAQGDRQWLFGFIEPGRLAIISTTSFQTHCTQVRAKTATDARVFCRTSEEAKAKQTESLAHPIPAGPSAKSGRRTLTVMFTDMKGYSTLMGQDEAAALRILEQHNAVMDPCIPVHDGLLIKTIGDSYMVCFQSALDGLQCAFAMQEALSNLRLNGKDPVEVRIGINTGDVVVGKDDDLYGDVVNVTKRIEAEARPGGICISESVRQNISASERKHFIFQDTGELTLKGTPEPVKCCHVMKVGSSHAPLISGRLFVPQQTTKNPSIYFNDATDLIGDRAGTFSVPDGAKAYLRVYPSIAVARINTELEAKNLLNHGHLKPLGRSTSWGVDRNSFGAITFESSHDGALLYFTQLFLSRELWGVDCVILNEDRLRAQLENWGQPQISPKYIATGYIEQFSVEALEEYLIFAQSHLKLPLPLNVEAGLVGIKGYSLTVSEWQMRGKALRDAVCWSDQILSYEKPAWEILAGFFNRIWDNCGLERPPQLQAALARTFQARQSR